MIINGNVETVTVLDVKNRHTRVEHVWTREKFSFMFGIEIPPEVDTFVFEPLKNIFHVVNVNGVIVGYTDPMESPLLSQIATNVDAIIHQAIGEMLPNHEYSVDRDVWEIPEERKAELDFEERQSSRLNELTGDLLTNFKITLMMYDWGRRNKMWKEEELDPEMVKKINRWRTLIDEFERKV